MPEEQWGEPFPEDAELARAAGTPRPGGAAGGPRGASAHEPAESSEREPQSAPPPFDAEADSTPPAHAADSPAPEPEPDQRPGPTRSDPSSDVDQETEEYELEPEDEEGNDVLESTPEFLQDAPDHDRLWFEQRPPRDFDFDG